MVMKLRSSLALAILTVAAHALLAQANDGSKPSINNVPGASYPRVSSDGRVTFRVKAPTAQKVAIEPLNGNVEHTGYNGMGKAPYEMIKDSEGYWTVTTPLVTPGFHYYSVLIDGNEFNDPSSETFFGANRELSGVEVPEPGVDFYLVKETPHGIVRIFWFFSKVTGQWRRAFVYTPPSYDANVQQRYPVLYLRHGGGENETGWVNQGHVNFILDNLIAAGKAKPMIVVMESGMVRLSGQTGTPDNGPAAMNDALVKETITDLIPSIDANFRTRADREHRALAGLSMGSAQTLQIGLSSLDQFSALGVFSRPPVEHFDPKTAFNGVMADSAVFNTKLHLFWFGAGTEETGIFNSLKETRAAFDKAGVKYTYTEYPGLAHEWQIWRKQLNDFAPLLFKW